MRWRVLLGEKQEIPAITVRISITWLVLNFLASDSLDSAFRTSWSIPVVTVGSITFAHIGSEIMADRRKKIAREMYKDYIRSIQ